MGRGGEEYAGVDWFRMAAAVMVIAIHTAPFSGISSTADQLVTYGACRVAVPFFFMTTGYFVLGSWMKSGFRQTGRAAGSLKKTLKLYLAAVILYFPVSIYAGNVPDSPGKLLKDLIFDGTFYHLWYFPAVLIGVSSGHASPSRHEPEKSDGCDFSPLSAWTGRRQLVRPCGRCTRDGNVLQGSVHSQQLHEKRDLLCSVFPGAGSMDPEGRMPERSKRASLTGGLAVSLCLMLAEGYISFYFNLQRHNSMYLFLPPVMYCCFSSF